MRTAKSKKEREKKTAANIYENLLARHNITTNLLTILKGPKNGKTK